jgi:hypothetical protein
LAAFFAVLSALRRAVARDLGTYGSFKVNNFFLFVVLLVYGAVESGVEPKSAEPLLMLLGLLLLFPISADPLGRMPPSRAALWPLTFAQRFALRIASLALSPVLWVAVLIMWVTMRRAAGLWFLAFAIGVQVLVVLGPGAAHRDPHWNLFGMFRPFPDGWGDLSAITRASYLACSIHIWLCLWLPGVRLTYI